MNNKVKKRKHRKSDKHGHRYDRCPNQLSEMYDYCNGKDGEACRCGKVRPLNNKVEG